MIKGIAPMEAIEKATFFLSDAIEEASRLGLDSNHGVPFEKYLFKLL